MLSNILQHAGSAMTVLFENNTNYFIIIIAALIGKFKEVSKRNIISVWAMYLIGTFFHELAHFIVSFFTFGSPSWFSVFPSKTKDAATGATSYTLGYVNNRRVRWYNVLFISMAPLLLLPLSYFVYKNFFLFFSHNIIGYILYVFIIITLIYSSIPSSVDFKNIFIKYYFKSNSAFLRLIHDNFYLILNLIPASLIVFVLSNYDIYPLVETLSNYIVGACGIEKINIAKGV